jgi:hypothetical protein
MRASRFSEEQIIGNLREQKAGAKTPDVCRRHGSRTQPSNHLWTALPWQEGSGSWSGNDRLQTLSGVTL